MSETNSILSWILGTPSPEDLKKALKCALSSPAGKTLTTSLMNDKDAMIQARGMVQNATVGLETPPSDLAKQAVSSWYLPDCQSSDQSFSVTFK